jgi:hypothetical protein
MLEGEKFLNKTQDASSVCTTNDVSFRLVEQTFGPGDHMAFVLSNQAKQVSDSEVDMIVTILSSETPYRPEFTASSYRNIASLGLTT